MSEEDFKRALDFISNSPKKNLSDKQKLEMYGLYKQITSGACKTGVIISKKKKRYKFIHLQKAPSRLKFVERAKW